MVCPTCGAVLNVETGACPACGHPVRAERGARMSPARGKVIPFRPAVVARPRRDPARDRGRGRPGRPFSKGPRNARRLTRYIWVGLAIIALLWPYLKW
jgi:hypothetical protein